MRKISQRLAKQTQKKRSAEEALEERVDIQHHQSWRQGASRPTVTHELAISALDTGTSSDLDYAALDTGAPFEPPFIVPHNHISAREEAEDDDLYLDPDLQQAAEEINQVPRISGELLRLEAPAAIESCAGLLGRSCEGDGHYQCLTCFDDRLYCQSCMISGHAELYLHRLQFWTGQFFWKTTLAELGLRFTVIDLDGIYRINLDYCNCHTAQPRDVQLLRRRLYPATSVSPETCATFRCLEVFQIMTFMSKISAYEFYWALSRLTDNTGTNPPPNRYQLFLRMIRQWRHLKLVKRMGRGNEPSGRAGTTVNDLVVKCPCCPQPGINMPDIASIPLDKRWLYPFTVSSRERDPALNNGNAYFVEETVSLPFLKTYEKRVADETSSCNKHDALELANIRGGKGTDSSGVGAVVCSRHDMKRGSAVVNLKKGEKYLFMDYAVGRTDGEAPERGWAASNGAAASTKEMGPGSRLDTLDDHFGDQNWRKVASGQLLKKIKDAVKHREEQVVGFVGFEMSIEDRTAIPQWRVAVHKWEKDPMALVRRKSIHTFGSTTRLKKEVTELGNHPTDRQKANIQQKCNCLRRRIEAWFTIQGVYMPASTVQRMTLATSSTPMRYVLNGANPAHVHGGTRRRPSLSALRWIGIYRHWNPTRPFGDLEQLARALNAPAIYQGS
ncbi:hypothetical protein BDZ89DRAFT_1096061 [Hymenopellis radicata]|nr:hypothetical protein BDZ89DRAFT_1096061 [Hymenopellis radicata]